MANLIRVRIDVTLVDKARLFTGKMGAKYLDLTLQPHASKFGDTHMVLQSCSKEERAQGLKMPIIGNAREFQKGETGQRRQEQQQPPDTSPAKPAENINEDVPF